ncbi:MAG: PEP-CTERM sorting domain-containing protein, partial [Candidatus Deferrimicrobiaceae bacterium]
VVTGFVSNLFTSGEQFAGFQLRELDLNQLYSAFFSSDSGGDLMPRLDIVYAPAPVPEPSTLLLLGSGLVGLVGFGRKKFKK